MAHIHIPTSRVFGGPTPDVSPPLSALQQRPAGSFQGWSPAWSTDRTQRCRSTQSQPPHSDLHSGPTDRPACPVPDCAAKTKRQKQTGCSSTKHSRWNEAIHEVRKTAIVTWWGRLWTAVCWPRWPSYQHALPRSSGPSWCSGSRCGWNPFLNCRNQHRSFNESRLTLLM